MRKINNTAEIQAVVEVLLFLLAQLDSTTPVIEAKASVVIHSDSSSVVDII